MCQDYDMIWVINGPRILQVIKNSGKILCWCDPVKCTPSRTICTRFGYNFKAVLPVPSGLIWSMSIVSFIVSTLVQSHDWPSTSGVTPKASVKWAFTTSTTNKPKRKLCGIHFGPFLSLKRQEVNIILTINAFIKLSSDIYSFTRENTYIFDSDFTE